MNAITKALMNAAAESFLRRDADAVMRTEEALKALDQSRGDASHLPGKALGEHGKHPGLPPVENRTDAEQQTESVSSKWPSF